MNPQDFPTLLNSYLANSDRSANWLASRLGVSPATISRWLSGEFRPASPEIVLRIAGVFGIRDPNEIQRLLFAAGYGADLNTKATSVGENEPDTPNSPFPLSPTPTQARSSTRPRISSQKPLVKNITIGGKIGQINYVSLFSSELNNHLAAIFLMALFRVIVVFALFTLLDNQLNPISHYNTKLILDISISVYAIIELCSFVIQIIQMQKIGKDLEAKSTNKYTQQEE